MTSNGRGSKEEAENEGAVLLTSKGRGSGKETDN